MFLVQPGWEVLVQSESGSSLCFPEGSLGSTNQVYPLNLVFVLTILLLTLLFPWRERDEHLHLPQPFQEGAKTLAEPGNARRLLAAH